MSSRRWPYDVLRALDHFRFAAASPQPRVEDAVQLVATSARPGSTWLLDKSHAGEAHFVFEDGDGQPSRWNTRRALRVPGVGRQEGIARRARDAFTEDPRLSAHR